MSNLRTIEVVLTRSICIITLFKDNGVIQGILVGDDPYSTHSQIQANWLTFGTMPESAR